MSTESKIEQCKKDIKKLEENLRKLEQEQEAYYAVGAVFRGAGCITMLTKYNGEFHLVYLKRGAEGLMRGGCSLKNSKSQAPASFINANLGPYTYLGQIQNIIKESCYES